MEKLDRLGWAAGLAFVSHGVRVGIRVSDPASLSWLVDYLPPGWRPSPTPVVDELCSLMIGGNAPGSRVRRFHLLYWGASRVARTLDLDEIGKALESWLELIVAQGARRHLFVRAGVVGWEGQAILLPGPHGSGKTNLVAALVRAGAAYYSDRYAVLDGRGRVHAFPKKLDQAAKAAWPEDEPGKAGGKDTPPLPVGLVAFLKYQRQARWCPRRLSPGQALLSLLAHSIQARLRPRAALATFQTVVASALALRGKRGEAAEVVEALVAGLAHESRAPEPAKRRSRVS
jgi:hypothetical protein